jgi:GTP-binding protein
MVDSVLLLVDAVDGPMPQTRFVTQKAFARGLNAHRRDQQGGPSRRASGLGDGPGVRPLRQARRHRRTARLPGVYASALNGYCRWQLDVHGRGHDPAVRGHRRARAPAGGGCRRAVPDADLLAGLQQLCRRASVSAALTRGKVKTNTAISVVIVDNGGKKRNGRICRSWATMGLKRAWKCPKPKRGRHRLRHRHRKACASPTPCAIRMNVPEALPPL